jgi:hypothetical protein
MPLDVISTVQIRSRSIVIYNKVQRIKGNRSILQQISDQKLKERAENKEAYSGTLCNGAKKRLTKSIELLTQAAFKYKEYKFTPRGTLKAVKGRFKLNFITLTIHNPGKMIAGKEGHKLCLEPLLKWLRDKMEIRKECFLYVWKAELQAEREDCKQLHYHLTTNCYIDKFELWEKWGELNERAGYLDQWFEDQPRFKVDAKRGLLINYPVAGTDVHPVRHIKDMAGYLKKCICNYKKQKDGSLVAEYAKDVQNAASVGGKVWDCSLNLKYEKYYIIDETSPVFAERVDYNECSYSGFSRMLAPFKDKKNIKKAVHLDSCSVYTYNWDAFEMLDWYWKENYFHAMNRILQTTG